MFDISLDELRNYNGWDADLQRVPGPGGTVRIPPGAKFIDPNATTTTAAAGATDDTTGSADSTPADGSSATAAIRPTRCRPAMLRW